MENPVWQTAASKMGKASTKFLGLGGGVTRRQTLDKLGNPLLSKEIKVMESGGAPCLGRRFLSLDYENWKINFFEKLSKPGSEGAVGI